MFRGKEDERSRNAHKTPYQVICSVGGGPVSLHTPSTEGLADHRSLDKNGRSDHNPVRLNIYSRPPKHGKMCERGSAKKTTHCICTNCHVPCALMFAADNLRHCKAVCRVAGGIYVLFHTTRGNQISGQALELRLARDESRSVLSMAFSAYFEASYAPMNFSRKTPRIAWIIQGKSTALSSTTEVLTAFEIAVTPVNET